MRRAHMNMSWSDSMSSSITLTGSRVNVQRQHGTSRLARGAGQGTAASRNNNQVLQRLVRELHESRIEEESEEESFELPSVAAPVPDRSYHVPEHHRHQYQQQQQQQEYSQRAPSAVDSIGETHQTSASQRSSRSKRLIDRFKHKIRRLAHLISYYASMVGREYAASVVYYRPIQMGMY
ncbi:hypothetical protein H4R99_004868 [Coemansia sp. RSA 1722]|nr:hypothetical protein H4R99_004868 [Coemansia sp. RSA 1722]